MTIYFGGYSLEFCEEIVSALWTLYGKHKTFGNVAEHLGVSPASVSLAINRNSVSTTLAEIMHFHKLVGPIPEKPKDIRERRWMRTDDVELAKKVFEEEYPEWKVVKR